MFAGSVVSKSGRGLGVLILGVTLAAVSGCGTGKPTGRVSGNVVYKGKAITEGNVNLHSSQTGIGAIARIDGSGHFQVEQPLDVGKYSVYVTPPEATPPPPGTKVTPTRAAIPSRARDPMKSGLSVEVKAGENDVSIELLD